MSAAITRAVRAGATRFVVPTAGNAGVASAAYAARAGASVRVFAPRTTPRTILSQIVSFGGDLVLLDGQIGDCGKASRAYAAETGAMDLSTLREPYRIEGKKTLGLEIAMQFNWTLPDAIIYPTGGGTGLIGMWKAFDELEALGWIGPERPKMFAVQASGCAPIVKAFEEGVEHAERWENAHTVAAGIRVPRAVGDFLILRAVRESGGNALAVDDADILRAVDDCARQDGLLMCPEGGATLAAWRNAVRDGLVDAGDEVVLFNCATGLKYPMPEAENRLDGHEPIDLAKL